MASNHFQWNLLGQEIGWRLKKQRFYFAERRHGANGGIPVWRDGLPVQQPLKLLHAP